MVDKPHTKPELRRLLRQRRNALSPSQQRAAAQSLVDSAVRLPAWTNARHVSIYLATDGEIDTGPLEAAAREKGIHVYLPIITDTDSLLFNRWESGEVLVKNRYGIPEPTSSTPCSGPSSLDIIFMPLVGWDMLGNRLGMGGGFYDRTLSDARAKLLVGLAHECQRVDEVPCEGWDVRLDYIVTDAALYRSRGIGEEAEVLFGKNNPGL
jgi:5-formyltetrahydrofolate cyclo-ligase